jgi:hypothetical protein
MEAVAVKETSVVSDEIEVCPHSANRPSPTDHQGEPHATSCPQFRCPFRSVQPRRAITGRGYVFGRNTAFVRVHHLLGGIRQLLTHAPDCRPPPQAGCRTSRRHYPRRAAGGDTGRSSAQAPEPFSQNGLRRTAIPPA